MKRAAYRGGGGGGGLDGYQVDLKDVAFHAICAAEINSVIFAASPMWCLNPCCLMIIDTRLCHRGYLHVPLSLRKTIANIDQAELARALGHIRADKTKTNTGTG